MINMCCTTPYHVFMYVLVCPTTRMKKFAVVSAGMHAQVLNQVVSEMKEAAEDPSSYDSIDEKMGGLPLKEVLGHTPRQARDLFSNPTFY